MGKTRFRESELYGAGLGVINSSGTEKLIADTLGRMYLNFEPGDQYFVDGTGGASGNDGLTWNTALDTITAALAKCTANKGDVIWVAPWHTEDIVAAAGLVFNKAGVAVIGLGSGSLRPTITLKTLVTADIDVTADNTTIKNFRFVCARADINHVIELDAENLVLEDCEFLDADTDENCKIYIDTDDTDNSCDGLVLRRCVVISPDTANEHVVHAQGDIDRLTVEDCYVSLGLNNGESIIEGAAGKSFTNCKILRNYLYRPNTEGNPIMASDQSSNSGVIAFNLFGHSDNDGATPVNVTGTRLFENYALGENDTSGLLLPAVTGNSG